MSSLIRPALIAVSPCLSVARPMILGRHQRDHNAPSSIRRDPRPRVHCRRLRPRLGVAPSGTSAAITPLDLEVRLSAFAHDSMMGREAGTIWKRRPPTMSHRSSEVRPPSGGRQRHYFQIVPNIRPRDASATRAPARNVIGIFPGTDPALRGEYVAITGHNDHIGYTHRPVDHDSLRAFNTIVRPLGADSPMREPSPDEWVAGDVERAGCSSSLRIRVHSSGDGSRIRLSAPNGRTTVLNARSES